MSQPVPALGVDWSWCPPEGKGPMSHGDAPSPTFHALAASSTFPAPPSPQVSGDRYEGKVRAFEVLARGAAQEPEGWRHGVARVRDAVSEEKQKVKEERRKKLETFDSTRVRLESLQDLEAIVRLRKHKRSRKRVRPKEPEPAVPAEPVDAARFLQAVLENQVPMIDKYLADGGDPDAHDQFRCTALHWACLRGHAEIVDKLLAAGAKLEPRDMLEATPMLWACRGGHLDILQRLLDRGAKISTRDKLRSTALHVAVRTGHCDCAEHLIACGAEIDAQDKEGDTPIHDAIRLGRFKAVKTLLMYGANLSVRNQEALRPVDLVKDWQRGIRQTLQACADQQRPPRPH
ncbi:ankyrin repeat domain-containing protein 23 isoform X2 [Malaclemys terrapin pileata]|uniref:ankyrin repeat domain-containing protein 23 isoform X2 n=1 Tax=Malaclemys terrapin pileata TaxID=2991368 RepID=UPI0023A899E8|nr:ankyrin repeat domain-containing protein 23 isoform X2 [Malaclemys terrapin pileata]